MYILEDFGKYFGGQVISLTTNNRLNFKKTNLEEYLSSKAIIANLTSKELDKFVIVTQVHGDKILKITDPNEFNLESEADGLITNNPQVLLGIKSADCAVLIAFDPIQKVTGIVHLGRKGCLLNLGQKLINMFQSEYGSTVSDIKCAISPCISFHSHFVFEEEAKGFEGVFCNKLEPGMHRLLNPHLSSEYINNKKITKEELDSINSYMIDLPGFIKQQLCTIGILPEMIRISPIDTHTHPQSHSYRRDYPENGLMISVIGQIQRD